MDPELEETAAEGDVAEQQEEWTDADRDEPLVPDPERPVPIDEENEATS